MTAIYFLDRSKTLVYLVNISTVSLLGGVLLLPILGLNIYYPFSIIGLILSFGVIVIIMFFEHLRRCKRLGVSILMTASWVMFRTVALGIVLILSI